MSHSHMPIKHLLRQIETYSARRNNRDVRPDWLTALIDSVAELFEPIAGVGRVGYDCQLGEECWVVGMFLGSTELVGGKFDGRYRRANFELDLSAVARCFDEVDEFYWSAFPEPPEEAASDARSFLTIAGRVGEHALRLQVFATPPDDAGAGLREFPNGNRETV